MSNIRVDVSEAIAQLPIESYQGRINEVHTRLHSGQEKFAGWVDYPSTVDGGLIWQIMTTAWKIQKQCTAFVVIGIGGSYLGAKSCIELLQSPFYNEFFAKERNLPKVYFAGHHLSSVYYHELLHNLKKEEVCVCVISRSGKTLEPMIVFDMFKDFLKEKYGENAKERIYAITGTSGPLREEAEAEGYTTFDVPDDIVGRFSVLTPVGLLPIAVAGIDLEAVLQGARQAELACSNPDLKENECYQYALVRHLLMEQGKDMEIFEVYDGKLRYFTEWLKQLFSESECKDGKGIFTASLQMSTDLHSMGQFLQEGKQNFFETAVIIEDITYDVMLPNGGFDGVKTLHQLNRVVRESVKEAHIDENNTPNIVITLPEISAYTYGKMVYFFEKACAVSSYLNGIDPFTQPGVESYKHKIRERLGIVK